MVFGLCVNLLMFHFFSSTKPFVRKSRPEERTVPVVIACVHTFQNKCTVHGNDCKLCLTGITSNVSTYVLDFKVVHCEFYFPKPNVTYTVNGTDMRVLRLPGRTYETEEGKDYYLFWQFMVSDDEYKAMIAYLDSRLGVEYDLATFFGYFGFAAVSCFLSGHRMKLDHYTIENIPVYKHGLDKETCARLVMGTLINGGIIENRDIRLVNCRDVFDAVKVLDMTTHKWIATNQDGVSYVDDNRLSEPLELDEKSYFPSDELVRHMQNPFAAPEHEYQTLVTRDASGRPIVPFVQRHVVRMSAY